MKQKSHSLKSAYRLAEEKLKEGHLVVVKKVVDRRAIMGRTYTTLYDFWVYWGVDAYNEIMVERRMGALMDILYLG